MDILWKNSVDKSLTGINLDDIVRHEKQRKTKWLIVRQIGELTNGRVYAECTVVKFIAGAYWTPLSLYYSLHWKFVKLKLITHFQILYKIEMI